MSLTLSKSRIEALSDGIFAITMTLLVLELKVPEVMHHDTNETMLHQLLALQGQFMAYVVTFLIAGLFWYLHHLTFHFIRHVNNVLVVLNLTFLMFVSLLPFSVGLLGHLFVHPVSQFFYFGNLFAIALSLTIHWEYAKRSKAIVEDEPEEVFELRVRVALLAAVFAACFLTAIVAPEYSWVPVLAYAGVRILIRIANRKKKKVLRSL